MANYLPEGATGRTCAFRRCMNRTSPSLPPAFIYTAGFDPLVDQGHAYADKLAAAGVKVTRHCFDISRTVSQHSPGQFPRRTPRADASRGVAVGSGRVVNFEGRASAFSVIRVEPSARCAAQPQRGLATDPQRFAIALSPAPAAGFCEPKLPRSAPSLPIRYLWKFQRGSASSPNCAATHSVERMTRLRRTGSRSCRHRERDA